MKHASETLAGVLVAVARGAASLAFLITVSPGCGHSVKPTDAFRDPASLPTGLEITATQEAGAITLTWTVSGDAYQALDGWNVYRKEAMNGPATRLNPALVPDVYFRDESVVEGAEYFYSVRGVSPAGIEGLPTHDLVIRYDSVAPAAPTDLNGSPEANAVFLVWDAATAPDLAEYRVYRDGALHAALIHVPEYRDMPVGSDRAYRYRVTAVDANGNESVPSNEVEVTPLPAADTTPPPVPTGLGAASEGSGIRVSWSAVSDAALLGYFVYRRRSDEALFVRPPGSGLTTATDYLDAQVVNGQTYFYAVTAVDSSGNESAQSASASAAWAARAIDTGGVTLGSVYPWCGVVANSGRMQFLIPASDLNRAGAIDSLFLWIQSGAAVYNNVTVRLAHTTAPALQASFAGNELAAAEPPATVFGPSTFNSAVDRQGPLFPMALQAPFQYDGTQNLLLDVAWSGDDGRTVVFAFRSRPGSYLRLWQQPTGGATGNLEQNQQFIRVTFAVPGP